MKTLSEKTVPNILINELSTSLRNVKHNDSLTINYFKVLTNRKIKKLVKQSYKSLYFTFTLFFFFKNFTLLWVKLLQSRGEEITFMLVKNPSRVWSKNHLQNGGLHG